MLIQGQQVHYGPFCNPRITQKDEQSEGSALPLQDPEFDADHYCYVYFFLTSFRRTCSPPTKMPLPCARVQTVSESGSAGRNEMSGTRMAHVVRFGNSPCSDLGCDLTESLLVDPTESDRVRRGRRRGHIGRQVDENGVGEPEFEVQALFWLPGRVGRCDGGRGGDVFDGSTVTYADEADGEGVAFRDADDGVGEESAREAPNGSLVLDGRVLDADDIVRSSRCTCLVWLLLLLLQSDKRRELDGELTFRSSDDGVSRCGGGPRCWQRRQVDLDGTRNRHGCGTDVRLNERRRVERGRCCRRVSAREGSAGGPAA